MTITVEIDNVSDIEKSENNNTYEIKQNSEYKTKQRFHQHLKTLH